MGIPATLTVALNTAPIADAGGPYNFDEGSIAQLDASGSLDNEGDTLQYRWDFDHDGTWDTAWSTSPTSSYTWTDDFTGTVRLEITDGVYNAEDTGSVSVHNVAPILANLTVVLNEDISSPIVLSINDPSDDILMTYIVGGPMYGLLSGVPPLLTYTPDPDYNGTDTFRYLVTDDDGAFAVADVSIIVAAINDPPSCLDDAPSVNEDQSIDVEVTLNDSAGPPDEDQTLSLIAAVGASHGTLETSATGSVSYTPVPDYFGPDAFTYYISDSAGLSASCAVLLSVSPVNDLPTITVSPASQTIQYSDAIEPITISANDIDSASISPETDLPLGLTIESASCAPEGIGVSCSWQIGGDALLASADHALSLALNDGHAITLPPSRSKWISAKPTRKCRRSSPE